MTYLELVGQFKDVAAIFVVFLGIAPNEAHLLLEGIPAFEVCETGGGISSVHTSYFLLHTLQRGRVPDDLVVIGE
jgi:hypothetical protein